MTNSHIIKFDMIKEDEEIEVFYDNQGNNFQIIFDNNERFIQSFVDDLNIDCIIIEIIQKDNVDEKYFLLTNEDIENIFIKLEGSEIYIPQFPGSHSLSYSSGHISHINKKNINEFSHNANTYPGSSGSPIFLIKTKEVIGIHKGTNKKYTSNFGDFIFPK